MKKLNSQQILYISGGDWADFIDGGCAVVGTTTAIGLFAKNLVKLTPQGRVVVIALDVACAGWAIYNHM